LRSMLCVLGMLAAISIASAQSSIPLEVTDAGFMFVRVRLADSIEARLMLDTGAGINTLSGPILKRLGSQAHGEGSYTGTRYDGEKLTAPVSSVSSIALGARVRRNVFVGEYAPDNADGLLSMDFFRDQPFTLDLKDGLLIIESRDHLADIAKHAAVIPIRLKATGPHELEAFVRVCAGDSVEAESEFDTGSGFNRFMLQPASMQRLGITPDGSNRGAPDYVYATVLPELHLCDAPEVKTTRPFVGFKQGLIYEGLIGDGMFRDRRLTIDIPGRRMLSW
jgi:aspartyl protease